MRSDIEIAQACTMKPIGEIAARVGIPEELLEQYGRYKAKVDYLRLAEEEGAVLDVSGDIPRSFVVADHPYHRQIVYLSQLSPAALQRRAERGEL